MFSGYFPKDCPETSRSGFDAGHTPEPYEMSIQFKTRGTRYGDVQSHLYHVAVARWTDPARVGTFYRAELTPSRTVM